MRHISEAHLGSPKKSELDLTASRKCVRACVCLREREGERDHWHTSSPYLELSTCPPRRVQFLLQVTAHP